MATSGDINAKLNLQTSQWEKELSKVSRSLKGGLGIAASQSGELVKILSQIHAEANALAKLSDKGLIRKFIADEQGNITTQVTDVNALLEQTQARVAEVTKAWHQQRVTVESNVKQVQQLEEGFTRPALNQAADRLRDTMRRLRGETSTTANELIRIDSTSRRIDAGGGGGQQGPPPAAAGPSVSQTVFPLIQVAAQVKQTTALSKVMHGMRRSIDRTGESMKLYRQAMLAPAVNPDHNIVKSGIQSLGDTITAAVEKVRSTVDATLSGGVDTVKTTQGVLGDLMGTWEDVTNTVGKWQHKSRQSAVILEQLKSKFPGLSGRIEEMQGAVANGLNTALDELKAKFPALSGPIETLQAQIANSGGSLNALADTLDRVGHEMAVTAAKANGMAFVLTGHMEKLPGEAALYERAMYAANLPLRAAAISAGITAKRQEMLAAAMNFVTFPIRRVSDAWRANATVNRLAREELDRLEPKVGTVGDRMAAFGNRVEQAYMQQKTFLGGLKAATAEIIRSGRAAATSHRSMYVYFQVYNGVKMALTPILKPLAMVGRGFVSLGKRAVKALIPTRARMMMAGKAADWMAGKVGTLSLVMTTGATAIMTAGSMIQKSFSGMRKGAVSVGRAGDAMANKVGSVFNAGKAASIGFAVAATAAVGWGASLAIESETSATAFETIFKSASTAKALMAEITAFSASTPFAKSDLINVAQGLAAAQVPANEITEKLRILGDVAAGSNSDIGEIANVFNKVKNTGKLGLDQINQLAERNVPIYDSLQSTLGVTRTELLDMVSKGKLGFNDLENALGDMTSGTGLFAGAMAKQSTTTAGLLSTLKDNIAITMEGIASSLMAVFNVKGLLNMAIGVTQMARNIMEQIAPMFVVLRQVADSIFNAIWSVASSVFTALFGSGTGGLESMMLTFVTLGATVAWVFDSWPDIAKLVFARMTLSVLTFFNIVSHFFTGTLPATLSWAFANWKNFFFDAVNLSHAFLTNYDKNWRMMIGALWKWIKSAGTAELKFMWTPMGDGFQSEITKLDLPKRTMGALEETYTEDVARLSKSVSGSLDKSVSKAITDFNAAKALNKSETLKLDASLATKIEGPIEQDDAAAADKKANRQAAENKAVSIRSEESMSFLSKALRGGQEDKLAQQLKEQKQANVLAKESRDALIVMNRRTPAVRPASW